MVTRQPPPSPFHHSRESSEARHFREASHFRTSHRDTTHFRAFASLPAFRRGRPALALVFLAPRPVGSGGESGAGDRPCALAAALSRLPRPVSGPRRRPCPPAAPLSTPCSGGGLSPSSLHSAAASPPSRSPKVRSLQGLHVPIPLVSPSPGPSRRSWGWAAGGWAAEVAQGPPEAAAPDRWPGPSRCDRAAPSGNGRSLAPSVLSAPCPFSTEHAGEDVPALGVSSHGRSLDRRAPPAPGISGCFLGDVL